jgi:hypothetical protein
MTTPPRALVEEVADKIAGEPTCDETKDCGCSNYRELAAEIIALVRRACAEELRTHADAMAASPNYDRELSQVDAIRQAADRIEGKQE